MSEYPIVQCRICGKSDRACYCEPTKTNMVERSLCFNCLFWQEYVERKDDPSHIRVDGSYYVVAPENDRASLSMRGFGGSRFRIRLSDGKVITTTNLWHQGTIPEHFRSQLPDNAVFIYGESK